MKNTINQLLIGAPRLDNSHPAFAQLAVGSSFPQVLDCQLVLRSGYQVAGSLSRADEPGVLRLVAVAKRNDGAVVMADHYFREEDVVTIVVGRELPRAEKPSIILGH